MEHISISTKLANCLLSIKESNLLYLNYQHN